MISVDIETSNFSVPELAFQIPGSIYKGYPLCRCCTVEEVVAITKFIVSKEASFNTGYCFDLTGGRATY